MKRLVWLSTVDQSENELVLMGTQSNSKKMAGRGRGKPVMSFSMEQLGISKGEILSMPVLQPSLSYPPLDHKPLPIQLTTEMSYLIELKRDFTEYMRESPNNVQATVLNEDVERFCEDFEETITGYDKLKYEAYHDWNKMPIELKLSRKRKSCQNKKSKKKKDTDIAKKLAELEQKESTQQPAEEDSKEEGDGEEENGEGKEIGDVKDEEEDEMDDGTDYANEYFENGDNYYSEDDNDDDQFFDT
ncbi:DNA-directed RNA polymerase III subunit RPC7-like isoform X2 [Solenopsis invicta]|uniref:DNA-directed RNA polymerase III subunit RPC7-like isoform X2 n=1 Tax=Solenopsis invicta TaxID=13686 RepID=UPI0005959F9A|nr:DNA-directed RNA polymerase III subunit RPC7-like isoform X2 [Solenopsis invicta]